MKFKLYNIVGACLVLSSLQISANEIPGCPSKAVYSHSWQYGPTAYSTDKFDFSKVSALTMNVKFENRTGRSIRFSYPQLWTSRDSEQAEQHLPYSQLKLDPIVVQPGEHFSISGVVDVSSVPATDNILSFRHKFSPDASFGNVELAAPLVSVSFECLPAAQKSRDAKFLPPADQ